MSADDEARTGPVEHVLGEGSPAERAAFRARCARDPELALEVAEVQHLFERMRSLEVQPDGSLPLRLEILRREQERRAARRHRIPQASPPMVRLGAVAALAVGFFGVLMALEGVVQEGAPEPAREDATVARGPVAAAAAAPEVAVEIEEPVPSVVPAGGPDRLELSWNDGGELPSELPVSSQRDPAFHEILARVASQPPPPPFQAWVAARNDLALLRMEFRNRFTTTARREAIRGRGGNPAIEGRVQDLASGIAERLPVMLDQQDAPAADVALGLRALLASGSDTLLGRHRAVVQQASDWLRSRIGDLSAGERAIALAALTDLAIVRGGELANEVGGAIEALVFETLTPGQGRPDLLQWSTRAAWLGEAGRLFRLAPAFGVDGVAAYRARLLVATHLEERIEAREADHPDLLAAQRYGFDDLVDRDALDQRLGLWRAVYLKPDYVAMHHLAWSQVPVRPGWARFQRELRGISALPTPERIRDRAALLLVLATNFAAPGATAALAADG